MCPIKPLPVDADAPLTAREANRHHALQLSRSGVMTAAMARRFGKSVLTIRRWITRAALGIGLADQPRTGRPRRYAEDICHRLTAFYCQTTPFVTGGRWTLRWAAQRLQEDAAGVGAAPARSTIHRILEGANLKPHRKKYFLHITDPDFFPKMEHLTALFLHPTSENLFCFDECTGIQALLRLAPDVCPQMSEKQKRAWLEEFEYIRNGTIDVLAFLHLQSGTVEVHCRPDHTKTTFLKLFRHHVQARPATARLDYVMDNLAAHYSLDLCRLVAELSATELPDAAQLKTADQRRQWLQSDGKRILIHFTPFHGSWLNMVEIWFGQLTAKVLTGSFPSPDALRQSIEEFAKKWNMSFAHRFNWQYDGEGLHKKVVHRFGKFLGNSAQELHITFLTKQLKLMGNLILGYWDKVGQEDWETLQRILDESQPDLLRIIDQDEKPKRQKNARLALERLQRLLSDALAPREDTQAA